MAALGAQIKNREAFNWGCQRPANRIGVHPTRDTEWSKQEEKRGSIINPAEKDKEILQKKTKNVSQDWIDM